LPDGWLSCSLGDVVDYGKTEKAEPHEMNASSWILELEDIEKDTSRLLSRVTFAERKSRSTKNRFQTGDVLYGKLRPYLNKIIIADTPGYCTTEIIPLRPNASLNNRYLFYWLKHPTFLDYVTAVSHGLNMPRLGTEAGKQAPFILAPFTEQTRIAEKLTKVLGLVDSCRTRLDRLPALLKRYRQSVIAAATSGRLTEEWRVKNGVNDEWIESKLSSLCRFIDYRGKTPTKTKSGLPLITAKNVRTGYVTAEPREYIAEKAYDAWMTRGIPRKNDVLITTEAPMGNVALINWDFKFALAQRIICLQFHNEVCLGEYAVFALQSPHFQGQLKEQSTGTTVEGIKAARLKELSLAIPTLIEQQEIVRRVTTLFAMVDRIEARLVTAQKTVERLTPATLAKAFRGELAPQDPNDEPASALLRRIKEQSSLIQHLSKRRPSKPKSKLTQLKGMKSKGSQSVMFTLNTSDGPLSASELFALCGHPSDADTKCVESFFVEVRAALDSGLITKKRVGDEDIFEIAQS
jgi:type I restriction enzyme, S subunit